MSSTCPICEGEHLTSTCPWTGENAAWEPHAGLVDGPLEDGEQALRRVVGARGLAPLATVARACEREVEVLETVDRDEDQRVRMVRARKLTQAVRDLRAGRLEVAGRSLGEAEQARPGDGWTALVRGYWALAGDRLVEATGAFVRAADAGGEPAFVAGAARMAGCCALVAGNAEVARGHLERARAEGDDELETEIVYQLARSTADPGALVAAAHPEPWMLGRARADALLTMIHGPLAAAEQRLAEESAVAWDAARERAGVALARCERWLALSEGRFHERSSALQAQLEGAARRAALPDPFAGQDGAEMIAAVPADAAALARDVRADVTAAMRSAVERLAAAVEDAEPALRATRECAAAQGVAFDLAEKLADVEQRDDNTARALLESARHETGVQLELLEVTGDEVAAREKVVAENRSFRHRADRAVLADVRGRMTAIHWLLAAAAALGLMLVWTGPGILIAVIPVALALLRAATGRAILRQRVWSIPRGEADDLAGELTTRMIIAVLLMVAMAIGAVIRWMVYSIG